MIGRKPLGALFSAVVVGALLAPAGSLATASAMTPATSATTSVPLAAARVPAVCLHPARRAFWPTRSKVQRVQKYVPVLAVGRSHGIPQTPPLNSLGKRSFGWDHRGPAPGSHHGNVRFNAHTWPDGSALGNRMLKRLFVGQTIVVSNDAGQAICYTVTKRKSVRPRSYTARVAYYRTTGKPRLAIAVCSGKRLGPGNWTRRTIWFAKPYAG
jgi:hypothetical protein